MTQKQEGNVDYFRGTPIALSDGTPVTLIRVTSASRFKYFCAIHVPGEGNPSAFFDANGVRQGTGLRLGNVATQKRYLIAGESMVFYERPEAISYAARSTPPRGVVEETFGDDGKRIGALKLVS